MPNKAAHQEKKKTFGELRKKWLPSDSGKINYLMPVCIGVIAQDSYASYNKPDAPSTETVFSDTVMNNSIKKIVGALNKHFGDFKEDTDSPNRNQLVILADRSSNRLTNYIADYLKDQYHAIVVDAAIADIDKYCWATITAFQNNKLRDASLQKKKADGQQEDSEDNTWLANQPNFSITLDKNKLQKRKGSYKVDLNQRNKSTKAVQDFTANAKITKRYNRIIKKVARHIDDETENVYDLLPWHHFIADGEKHIEAPTNAASKCTEAEKANLREIFCDVVSMKAQAKRKKVTTHIIVSACIALIFFSIYSDFPFDDFGYRPYRPFLAAFLAFMLLAFLIWCRRVWVERIHNEYLEFRALAEGMRVQCYWYTGKMNKFVGETYDVKFDREIQWAQKAFDAWYLADYKGYGSLRDNPDSANASPVEAFGIAEILTDQSSLTYKDELEQCNAVIQGFLDEYDILKSEWLGTLGYTPDDKEEKWLKKLKFKFQSKDKSIYVPQKLKAVLTTEKNKKLAEHDEAAKKEVTGLLSELGSTRPGGQYGYYRKRSMEHGKNRDSYGHWQTALLALWIVDFVLLFVSLFSSSLQEKLPFLSSVYLQDGFLIFVMGVINTVLAGKTCYAAVMADKELAAKYTYCMFMTRKALKKYDDTLKDYQKSLKEYENVLSKYPEIASLSNQGNAELQDARKQYMENVETMTDNILYIFDEFGSEALEENAEWLMIKDDCNPEIPT